MHGHMTKYRVRLLAITEWYKNTILQSYEIAIDTNYNSDYSFTDSDSCSSINSQKGWAPGN